MSDLHLREAVCLRHRRRPVIRGTIGMGMRTRVRASSSLTLAPERSPTLNRILRMKLSPPRLALTLVPLVTLNAQPPTLNPKTSTSPPPHIRPQTGRTSILLLILMPTLR